jgi:hypothetical protein
MRIRATGNTYVYFPKLNSPPVKLDLTIGKEYDVYALALFEESLTLQIIDDLNYPFWFPASLFEIVDRTVPNDWICLLQNRSLRMVMGPEFIAKDEESYNSMVEIDLDAVKQFGNYVKGLKETDDE